MELLASRKLDKSKKGFDNWTFMSVMSWGEQVQGDWVLSILDKVRQNEEFSQILLKKKKN